MGKIISNTRARNIANDWHGGSSFALYQFSSTGMIIEENYNKYLSEIEMLLSLDIKKYQLKKTKVEEIKKLERFFKFNIERKELIHHI